VGLPLLLSGAEGGSARAARDFVDRLRAAVGVPIEMLDERFTSLLAERTIRELGVGRKKRQRKDKIDEIAAVILLQGYLQMNRTM
jgi:putative holliday junction resolvase